MIELTRSLSFCSLFGVAAVLSACTLVTHHSDADASNLSLVCIVEKSASSAPNLLNTIELRLADLGIASQRGTAGNACEHRLEFTARNSDGSTPYLKNARFRLIENGKPIGTAKFRDRGGPAEKRAQTIGLKIAPVIDALMGVDSSDESGNAGQAVDQIERACTDLVFAYARHRDAHNVEPLVNLFTADARVRVLGPELVGRAALRERTQGASQGLRTKHLMSEITIDVHSDSRATGTSYVTVYGAPAQGSNDAPPVLEVGEVALVGYYLDEFHRTDHGWRIAARRLESDFVSPSVAAGSGARN